MNAAVRLGVFAVALLAAFAGALGVGRAVGPVDLAEPEAHDTGHGSDHSTDHSGDAEVGLPGGLASTLDGLTLVLDHTTYRPGTRELAFRVEDEHGDAVTGFDVEHDKLLHLVAVRRDLAGFQHVHPELDRTGTWRVPLDLTPGSWRVYADFTATGRDAVVLGADLLVPGAPDLHPRPPRSTSDEVDGYDVDLAGDLVAREHSSLTLTVTRAGRPVSDLEPYLGAYGHLVALRESDLAYLHVHPEDGPAGPSVEFVAEVPSPGRYHLFLDFKHGGVVRTADFVVEVSAADEHDH